MYVVPTHAVKNTSWLSRFFKDIRHIQKSSFSLTVGLRASSLYYRTNNHRFCNPTTRALSLVAIGATVLTSIEKVLPTIPSRILLLACFTEAASFGLGTLAATTNHLFSPILSTYNLSTFLKLYRLSKRHVYLPIPRFLS